MATAEGEAAMSPSRWWRLYRVAALDAAVDEALAHHGDIASALLRLRNADLRAEAAGAALRPTLNGGFNASANRPLSGGAQRTTRSFGSNLGVSWELDLWGRLATHADIAAFEREATQLDGDASAALLVASVVRQYWQIAALNERHRVSEQSLAHARRAFDLVRVQHGAGAISGLDLAQAEQSLRAQQMSFLALRQQRVEARNAMSILLDRVPGDLPFAITNAIESAGLKAGLADRAMLRPGTPSEWLARRPDLRAAEWRLRASLLNVRAQRLAYYPSFSLTGGFGTGSTSLAQILANPVATLGAGLSLPFLNIGEMRRNPRIAQNDYEIAIIGFRQTLLRAYAEVENALSAVAVQRETLERQRDLVARARRIEDLTEVRYRAGAIALRFWLDAQESRRQAELAEVDALLALLGTQVTMWQSLGMGASAQ